MAPADSAKLLKFMKVLFVNSDISVSPSHTKKRALSVSKIHGYWHRVSDPLKPAHTSNRSLWVELGGIFGMRVVMGLHISAIIKCNEMVKR